MSQRTCIRCITAGFALIGIGAARSSLFIAGFGVLIALLGVLDLLDQGGEGFEGNGVDGSHESHSGG